MKRNYTRSQIKQNCSNEQIKGNQDRDIYFEKGPSNAKLLSEEIEKCDDPIKLDIKDKMAEVFSLQKSNGLFEIPDDGWPGSVLNEYPGTFEQVNIGCPLGIYMHLWITALSMRILEIKMSEEKDLWDLVVQKSKKFRDLPEINFYILRFTKL